MTRTLTGVWQRLRHAPDRALHGFRRQQAIRQTRGHIPESVLFVCQGNLCRSPFAAGLFQRMATEFLPVPVKTSSAGFSGPGREAPPQAIAAAEKHGVDLSNHVSHLLTSRAVRSSDLVVAMSEDQARMVRRLAGRNVRVLVLGDLDPEPIVTRTVADPWRGSDELFAASYDRIERCLRTMIREMAQNVIGAPSPT